MSDGGMRVAVDLQASRTPRFLRAHEVAPHDAPVEANWRIRFSARSPTAHLPIESAACSTCSAVMPLAAGRCSRMVETASGSPGFKGASSAFA